MPCVLQTYYIYFEVMDVPIVFLGIYGFLWCLFSLGCAFGVALGVGALFYYQVTRNPGLTLSLHTGHVAHQKNIGFLTWM